MLKKQNKFQKLQEQKSSGFCEYLQSLSDSIYRFISIFLDFLERCKDSQTTADTEEATGATSFVSYIINLFLYRIS